MIGQRFGRLVVLARVPGKGRVECRCDCGTVKVLRAGDVRTGGTTSCGCYRRERGHGLTLTHGQAAGTKPTPTWITWRSMHQRCEDPNHKSYKDYGGRGISVCAEWSTFEQFFADMGERPPGLQLERVDNSKGYSKDNCVWATASAQARNRRERPRLSDGTFAPAGTT